MRPMTHTGVFGLHLDTTASLGPQTEVHSVRLPSGMNRLLWIASQVLTVYNAVVSLVNLLDGICTHETCPYMTAGKSWRYSWTDSENTVPVMLSAPVYLNTLVDWAHTLLSSGDLVPQDEGSDCPEIFLPTMKKLLTRFFRVFAHTYLSHFEIIRKHGAEPHLNISFKHYVAFCREFQLVNEVDWRPLQKLIQKFDEVRE